ncbi:hypothetical protein HG264_02010 [Pseudomonas sp. gcc21]|uniref:hypothetical protein n=1 Tax=Pseudomonas sp. gcc21 TaxID=2726989 RepID=UPI001451B8FE|nr:hypothetical protein [Pseudomonas sp. gcc21]QJD57769.1 hypothetical protein HG264_02010 [Pseudomonas sp. gcc21]
MPEPVSFKFRYALIIPVLGLATPGYAQPPAVDTESPGYSAEQARLEDSQLEPDLNEEEAAIRRLYTEYSSYVESVQTLSPELSRDIAKGKELPAGAGRNVNPRLLAKLPDYSGYEWREAGRDLVLIRSSDGVIVEMVSDVVGDEGDTPAGP